MTAELLGFLAGLCVVAAGGWVFLNFEHGRAAGLAYGRGPGRARTGNALIWPSH